MELLAVIFKSISRFAVASPPFAPKLPVRVATAFIRGRGETQSENRRRRNEGEGGVRISLWRDRFGWSIRQLALSGWLLYEFRSHFREPLEC